MFWSPPHRWCPKAVLPLRSPAKSWHYLFSIAQIDCPADSLTWALEYLQSFWICGRPESSSVDADDVLAVVEEPQRWRRKSLASGCRTTLLSLLIPPLVLIVGGTSNRIRNWMMIMNKSVFRENYQFIIIIIRPSSHGRNSWKLKDPRFNGLRRVPSPPHHLMKVTFGLIKQTTDKLNFVSPNHRMRKIGRICRQLQKILKIVKACSRSMLLGNILNLYTYVEI